MSALKNLSISSFFLFAATSAQGAVSQSPYELFSIPGTGLSITNSMVTTWVISLILIVVVRAMVGAPKLVPARGQMVVEVILDGVKSMMEPIVGKKMVKPCLPILATLFFFILIHNWSGLLPTVASFGHYDESGHLLYYYRPANSDLNNTIALATIAMSAWLFLVLKHAGLRVLFLDLFGNKADKKNTPKPLYLALTPVFLAVGVIEVVSICIRPVSLSLRLFGNVFGGESLLDETLTMAPWYIPVAFPFYMFELMVGFVQALVFCLLVSVYIGLICNHGDDEHH